MARAARTCNTCHAIITTGSRCADCKLLAERRRKPGGDPYHRADHRRRFREPILARNPICVICRIDWATVADHYPVSRRDLIAQGKDPNDPAHGRALCVQCHNRETARHQPGGWNT